MTIQPKSAEEIISEFEQVMKSVKVEKSLGKEDADEKVKIVNDVWTMMEPEITRQVSGFLRSSLASFLMYAVENASKDIRFGLDQYPAIKDYHSSLTNLAEQTYAKSEF